MKLKTNSKQRSSYPHGSKIDSVIKMRTQEEKVEEERDGKEEVEIV